MKKLITDINDDNCIDDTFLFKNICNKKEKNNLFKHDKIDNYIYEIFESSGAFTGQYGLSTKMMNDFRDFIKYDFSIDNNFIFEKQYNDFAFLILRIEINKDLKSPTYKSNNISFHKYLISINIPYIYINDKKHYKDVKNILTHELMHIFNDYNIVNKNKTKTLYNARKEYNSMIKIIQSDNLPEYIINFVYNLYLLTDIEIQANIPMIYSYLQNDDVQLYNVIDYMKRIPMFKKYRMIEKFNNKLINSNDNIIKDVLDVYNFIFNKDVYKDKDMHDTLINICNKMNKKSDEVIRKMIKNAKMYYDDLEKIQKGEKLNVLR